MSETPARTDAVATAVRTELARLESNAFDAHARDHIDDAKALAFEDEVAARAQGLDVLRAHSRLDEHAVGRTKVSEAWRVQGVPQRAPDKNRIERHLNQGKVMDALYTGVST